MKSQARKRSRGSPSCRLDEIDLETQTPVLKVKSTQASPKLSSHTLGNVRHLVLKKHRPHITVKKHSGYKPPNNAATTSAKPVEVSIEKSAISIQTSQGDWSQKLSKKERKQRKLSRRNLWQHQFKLGRNCTVMLWPTNLGLKRSSVKLFRSSPQEGDHLLKSCVKLSPRQSWSRWRLLSGPERVCFTQAGKVKGQSRFLCRPQK